MKYLVSIRGSRDTEFTLEAKDIQEASSIVRRKYPRHLGYSIKPSNWFLKMSYVCVLSLFNPYFQVQYLERTYLNYVS